MNRLLCSVLCVFIAMCTQWTMWTHAHTYIHPSIAAPTCGLSTGESEAGITQAQDQPGLYCKPQASQRYVGRPRFRT